MLEKIAYIQKVYEVYDCYDEVKEEFFKNEKIEELYGVDYETFKKDCFEMFKMAEENFYIDEDVESEEDYEEEI